MATAYTDQVQKVYIAYYGRAADPVGLAYWAAKVETDGLAGIMASFGASAEATTLFGSLTSNTAKVNALFQQSFGRDADFAGLMYYAGQLTAGTMTAASIAQNIFDGAAGTDATILANKLIVAKAYTAAIDTAGEVVAYSGTVAAASARALLTTVDAATVTASFDVATSVASIVSTSNSTVAVNTTFTLTSLAAGDDLAGSAGADAFIAVNTARLQSADVLDGGAGADTLTAKLNSATTHLAVMDSIETLNFNVLAASTMSGANITGETAVNVTGSDVLTYTLGVAGTAYSVAETAGLTLTQVGTDSAADSITATLNTGKVGVLTLGTSAAVDFETINLVVAGATTATVTEAGTPTFADVGDSIVVTGSGDITLNVAATSLGAHISAGVKSVVTATAHTGVLTLDIGNIGTPSDNKDFMNFSGYTGVDKVVFGSNSGAGSTGTTLTKVTSGTEIVIDTVEATSDDVNITQSGVATDDTLTFTLKTATAGTAIVFDEFTADGFETLTINSTGKDSAATVIKNTITGVNGTATDKNLVLSGDKKLTVADVEATWTNIDITNTVGVDITIAGATGLDVLGGPGADRIELANKADVNVNDKLNGGAGSDTLAFTAADDLEAADFTTAAIAAISNFEIIEFEGAQNLTSAGTGTDTVDLTKIAGVNTLKITGTLTTDTDDLLVIKAESGAKIVLGGAVVHNTTLADIQIKNAANAGTTDSVTIAMEKESAGAALAIAGFGIDNVETLNLEVKGVMAASDIISLGDVDGAQLQTINLTSTAGITTATGVAKTAESLTITTVESTLLKTFDATGYTGVLDITGLATKFSALGATITGSSAANTITGGVGADLIVTGKGADTILGGTGNDDVTSGGGIDTVLLSTGLDPTPEADGTVVSGIYANTDTIFATIAGKKITFTTTGAGVAAAAAGLKAAIVADVDLNNLTTSVLSTTNATNDTLTVTYKVDGNFTDITFGTITIGTGAVSAITNVQGTNSTSIDTASLGAGADFVHTGGGIDVLDLGGSDNAADTVYMLSVSEGADVITNFESGSIGTDVLKFDQSIINNGITVATLVSTTNVGATTTTGGFFEITTAAAAGAADTAAEIVTHLTGLTLTGIASGDDIVLAVNDAADMYLWHFIEDGSAGIQADDLALVGVLKGVTDIANGDLAFI